MHNILKLSLLLLIVSIYSCNSEIKTRFSNNYKNPQDSLKTETRKMYDVDGILKSIVTVRDTIYHGPAKVFYTSGKLAITCNYELGKKHGTETKYYLTGEKYRIRNYEKGKIQGLVTYYYQTGIKKATLTYKNGLPGNDLKEYTPKGKLVTNYPKIVFNLIDETNNALAPNGKRLQCRLSNWSSRVSFYHNELIDGKYLDPNSEETARNGKFGEILIGRPKPGEKYHIVAKFNTRNGCPKIISDTYILPKNL